MSSEECHLVVGWCEEWERAREKEKENEGERKREAMDEVVLILKKSTVTPCRRTDVLIKKHQRNQSQFWEVQSKQ